MNILKLASCMAENSELLCREIGAYIASELNIATQYITGIPWQARERRFDAGEIQVLWLCGLPYVDKADLAESSMELLAVPVPVGERYASLPVYFSDVIVRRDAAYLTFADLRGAAWAYNEPRSHSGFNVVRAHLAKIEERAGFFSKVIEAEAHSRAVQMVLDGVVDGAAIDSTVLAWIGAQRPAVMEQLRIVETLGPSPIPPWVVSTQVDLSLRRQLRDLLLSMHRSDTGQRILQSGALERFVAAEDGDYDPIRLMARQAEAVSMI